MTVCSLWNARAQGVNRIQQTPDRVRCGGRSFEQAAFHIEGRRRVSARAGGALRIELDFFACAPLVETREQLRPVDAGALRELHQGAAGLRELRPVVLLFVE